MLSWTSIELGCFISAATCVLLYFRLTPKITILNLYMCWVWKSLLKKELEFWRIDELTIEPCCALKYYPEIEQVGIAGDPKKHCNNPSNRRWRRKRGRRRARRRRRPGKQTKTLATQSWASSAHLSGTWWSTRKHPELPRCQISLFGLTVSGFGFLSCWKMVISSDICLGLSWDGASVHFHFHPGNIAWYSRLSH